MTLRLRLPVLLTVALIMSGNGGGVSALTLEDAILYVLETSPEIDAAEANKQAIEFELEQARNLRAPRFQIEAWGGSSRNQGTATPDLSSAQTAISGYEISGQVSQMLFDGFRTRSEIERQAYRIDSAAYRVLERSEVLSLDAVRMYSEVLRCTELLSLAERNLNYHRQVTGRLQGGYDSGVIGDPDLEQAQERLALAEDTVLEFQYNLEDARSMFLAVVGIEPTSLSYVPDISGSVPGSLEAAIGVARQRNPTLLFSQADVGSAEALSRSVDANRLPTLHLEAGGRIGEDVNGFYGDRKDARIGLVLRYEFQGNRKRAERQEQIRRVTESRSRLLSHARLVEREVRQSWITLQSAQRRLGTIQRQAELSQKLRLSYEKQFEVGQRSLLDVLNTQNAMFQAQVNLVNARSLETYVKYRLLAASGVMLATMGIQPPEDAAPYAADRVGAPGIDTTGDGQELDAKTFREWRNSLR